MTGSRNGWSLRLAGTRCRGDRTRPIDEAARGSAARVKRQDAQLTEEMAPQGGAYAVSAARFMPSASTFMYRLVRSL